jgi:hypothetical protein
MEVPNVWPHSICLVSEPARVNLRHLLHSICPVSEPTLVNFLNLAWRSRAMETQPHTVVEEWTLTKHQILREPSRDRERDSPRKKWPSRGPYVLHPIWNIQLTIHIPKKAKIFGIFIDHSPSVTLIDPKYTFRPHRNTLSHPQETNYTHIKSPQ